mgnify:CR=1 FL=1
MLLLVNDLHSEKIQENYFWIILTTHPIPKAANKNGIANPAEYTDNNFTPSKMEPPPTAKVRMAPNTGPTHGDHPAEKNIPIIAEER